MTYTMLTWCLFFIIAASVLFPVAAYIGVFAVLILVIKARKSRQLFVVLKRDSPIIAVLLSILLSTVWSKAMLLSFGAVIAIAIHLAFLLVLIIEARSIGWGKYFRLLDWLSVVAGIYGLYQFFTGNLEMPASWLDVNTYGVLTRIYSTFSNPNLFAGFLAVNLSFAVPRYKGLTDDLPLTAGIALSSLCLVLTYSRGGFAGFFISMLAIFLLRRNRKVLFYLCAMTVLFFAVNGAGDVSRADISSVYIDSSSQYRMLIWKSAANMFLDNPLLGNGVGTAWYFLSGGSDKLYRYVLHSHNIFLQVSAEMGVVGLVAFSYFIVSNMLEAFMLLKHWGNAEEAPVLQGFIVSMAGILIHGLVDAVIFLPRLSIVIIVYYGIYKAAVEAVKCKVAESCPELHGQSIPKLFGCEGSQEYQCYEKENEAY